MPILDIVSHQMNSKSGEVFDDFDLLTEITTHIDINDILAVSNPVIEENIIGDFGIYGELEDIFIAEKLKYNLVNQNAYQYYSLKLKTKYKKDIEFTFFKKSSAFKAYDELILAFRNSRN